MPRIRKLTPRYLEHKASGRGRAIWTDANGLRAERLLPGPFGSKESKTAFARLQLEIETSPAAVIAEKDIAVSEVLAAHLDFAANHYRRADGTQTHEVAEYRLAYRLVDELYAELPAVEFGPLALKTVRTAMLAKGWCRSLVNQRVGRVRRIFKWAAGEELIPFATYQALTTVTGLQRGRTSARESEPVGPVDDATIDATLVHLNRHVAGLVELQRLTGMRPGEACLIRRADIDTGGAVWLYKPAHHKLAYKNKLRVIAIGPKAQELLKRFFTPDLAAYLFSPRAATDEHHAERAANRVTPRYPSHMERNAKLVKSTKLVGDLYDVRAYGRAIARAVARANRDEPDKPIPHWHPHQLRHAHATKVRKLFSLEHAGATLGHAKMSATEIYAERDAGLAVEVAARIG